MVSWIPKEAIAIWMEKRVLSPEWGKTGLGWECKIKANDGRQNYRKINKSGGKMISMI